MPRESACNAKCSAATTRTVARSRSMAQCHFARAPLTPVLVPLVCLLRPRTHPNDLPSPCVSGDERTIPHPPSSLLLSARIHPLWFHVASSASLLSVFSALRSVSFPFARVMSRYYVTHSLSVVDSTSGGSFGSLFSLSLSVLCIRRLRSLFRF